MERFGSRETISTLAAYRPARSSNAVSVRGYSIMVWMWFEGIEDIEGILNPELSTAVIKEVAQRIRSYLASAKTASQRLIKLIKFQ